MGYFFACTKCVKFCKIGGNGKGDIMPKRFFIAVTFFCTILGVIGNSWAECDFMESGRPRIRDLYQTDPSNGKDRQALICEKGKCEDGEIVYARYDHYRASDKQSGGVLYKCNRSGNNSWDVLGNDLSYLEKISNVCGDKTGGTAVFDVNNPKGRVLGSIRGSGVFITDICVESYDKRCGVMCKPENAGKSFFCDEGMFYCDPDTYKFTTDNPIGVCSYTSPEQLDGRYNNLLGPVPDAESFSAFLLDGIDPKTGFTVDQICLGCSSGYYSDFSSGSEYSCVSNKDQAWCSWRKNKESKNTEWKTDHCECTDKGKEWNTEQHDCVDIKGSGKTGSGKTGSGSGKKGSGKTGGGTDTKCGVKCNAQNKGKNFYCDGDFLWCTRSSSGEFVLHTLVPGSQFDSCDYSNPETREVGMTTNENPHNEKISFFANRFFKAGENITNDVANGRLLCYGCKTGYYFNGNDFLVEDNCVSNKDEAWCKWRKNKDNINVEWRNDDGCKCLDSGKKWDTVSYTCIPDNGAGDDSGQGEKKITTKNCKININATVKCRNSGTFSGNVELELSAEDCHKYQANPGKNLSEIARLLCANRGGVDGFVSNAEVQEAKNRIDKFFEYAESNRNVWKNEQGKFNTARLASDATAGVILGTVGGIVSANIIKKKQLEKGYDVLHCTVGGQKVADWGDEFRVGLGQH